MHEPGNEARCIEHKQCFTTQLASFPGSLLPPTKIIFLLGQGESLGTRLLHSRTQASSRYAFLIICSGKLQGVQSNVQSLKL